MIYEIIYYNKGSHSFKMNSKTVAILLSSDDDDLFHIHSTFKDVTKAEALHSYFMKEYKKSSWEDTVFEYFGTYFYTNLSLFEGGYRIHFLVDSGTSYESYWDEHKDEIDPFKLLKNVFKHNGRDYSIESTPEKDGDYCRSETIVISKETFQECYELIKAVIRHTVIEDFNVPMLIVEEIKEGEGENITGKFFVKEGKVTFDPGTLKYDTLIHKVLDDEGTDNDVYDLGDGLYELTISPKPPNGDILQCFYQNTIVGERLKECIARIVLVENGYDYDLTMGGTSSKLINIVKGNLLNDSMLPERVVVHENTHGELFFNYVWGC